MDLVDRQKSEQTTEEGTQEKNDGPKQKAFSGNRNSNGINVFFANGIRCAFSDHNETNRFLLDYGFFVLFPISIIIYPILFIFS